MNSRYIIFGLLLILLIPSVWFLYMNGFIATDDGNWMVIRFSAFYQALSDGQFPVRFLTRLNYGYGYPVPNFLYPGFMYIGVPIQILGFKFYETIKIIIALSLIASGIFAYLWLKKVSDEISALIGSILYTYSPYHLFDAYKRGSVGELLSLSILPFILWQIERNSIFWISVGVGGLILSHNTLGFLFLAFIMLYMSVKVYYEKKRKKIMEGYIYSIALGLGLSAFFWLPAVFELSYTVFSRTKISNFSEYFADLNLIGVPIVFVIGVATILFITRQASIKKNMMALLMIIVSIISVFM